MWDVIIRTKSVARMLPILENILDGGKQKPSVSDRPSPISTKTQQSESVPQKDKSVETRSAPEFASADLFD
jgi:hypothetical protein